MKVRVFEPVSGEIGNAQYGRIKFSFKAGVVTAKDPAQQEALEQLIRNGQAGLVEEDT